MKLSATFLRRPLPAVSRTAWRTAAGLSTVAAACALYWTALLDGQQSQRAHLQEQTQMRVGQVARALATQVSTLFSGMDYTTRNLVASYEVHDQAAFLLAVHSIEETFPKGAVQQVAVTDVHGDVVYSSLSGGMPQTTTNLADREHFSVHATGQVAPGAMYIGRPVLGRISGLWGIPISRAILRDGAFAGTVYLTVSPSYLSGFFREVFDQPNDVVLLVRDDGAYLARSTRDTEVLGSALPSNRSLLIERGANRGNYEVTASVDNIRRYYAWSRTPGYPMVVSAGLDRQAALAPLEPALRASIVRSAVGTAVVLSGALLVAWLGWQRRRSRELLAASETRLRKLVAEVPGALFQARLRPGNVLDFPFASPGLRQLHRLGGAETPTGRRLLPLVHRDDVRRLVGSIAASARGLMPWDCKYRLRLADGEVRWLHGHANPERLPDGGVLWHGFLHDVTAEHAVEEALRDSEQRLRMTVNAVQDGLWEWNIADDVVRLDARCYAMLGYDGEDFVHEFAAFGALLHPRDVERLQNELRGHFDEGLDYRVEFRLRTADGGWCWIESRGEVTERDAGGRPLRMMGTHTDISERVESEHLVRALLDQSSAVIFVATPERVILHANERAEQVFAAPGEPLVGQNFRAIHPSTESFDATGEEYPELRQRGWTQREVQLRVRCGETRWFEAHGSLLDPGDPDGDVIWTLFDTTERHHAEAALSLAQQRLTALIARFPGGVLLDDPDSGRIVAANDLLCRLLGLDIDPGTLAGSPREALARRLPPDVGGLLLADTPVDGDKLGLETVLPGGTVIEIDQIALHAPGVRLGRLSIVRDVTERRKRESRLELLATTDTLTGLPNRRAFMARLQQEYDAVQTGREPNAVVVMLDIDHFKQVNDSWGHAAGDEVLRHLAALMGRELRRGDLAGRLGGEEFAILLPRTTAADGAALAERLRLAAEAAAVESGAGTIRYTVSFGFSVLDRDAIGPDSLLAQADAALYQSKHAGRNRVTAWVPGMGMSRPGRLPYTLV